MAGGTASGGMVVRFVDSVFAITGGPRLLPSPGRTASTGELGGVMAIRAALSGRKGSRRRPANSAVAPPSTSLSAGLRNEAVGRRPADSSSAGVFMSRASCTGRGEAPGHAVHAAVPHNRQEVCSQPHRYHQHGGGGGPLHPAPGAALHGVFTLAQQPVAFQARQHVFRQVGGGLLARQAHDQVARRRQGFELRRSAGSPERPPPRDGAGAA